MRREWWFLGLGFLTACANNGLGADGQDGDGDGYSSVEHGGDDCDDGDAAIHPDASELPDCVDNDCDGEIDEGVTPMAWTYEDADSDGYGNPATLDCAPVSESGRVGLGDDCDDEDEHTYPGAPELCLDGVVNDCEGTLEDARQQCPGLVELDDVQPRFMTESGSVRLASSAGDLDRDGLDDIVVVVGPEYEDWGLQALAAPFEGEVTLSAGEGWNEPAGWLYATSKAGDLDGDGLADLGVALYRADHSGREVLISFGTEEGLADPFDPVLSVPTCCTHGFSPRSMAPISDTDGDGRDEILIGGSAEASLLRASPGPERAFEQLATFSRSVYGHGVAAPGDVDGDGVDDVLVNPLHSDGSVQYVWCELFLGPFNGSYGSSDAQGGMGISDHVGDVDGDGYHEIIVSWGDELVIYRGASVPGFDTEDELAKISELPGVSGTGLGDLDGNGGDDIGVLSDDHDSFVLLSPVEGVLGLEDADVLFDGQLSELGPAGDTDGDGTPDLLLAFEDAVYVVPGTSILDLPGGH